jgi:hypothetical protein
MMVLLEVSHYTISISSLLTLEMASCDWRDHTFFTCSRTWNILWPPMSDTLTTSEFGKEQISLQVPIQNENILASK